MKQNNMGGGRGQGFSNYGHTGPLMTNHLQVKNLDRELEILRHKREVIQREQQMLSMEANMDRKRQYGQTDHNVSNMYGNVWQPSPPKRTIAPQRANPWMSAPNNSLGASMSKSMPTNYIPSLLSKKIDPPVIPMALKPIVHPILKNTVTQRLLSPVNERKDFHPTQVTKKKSKAPPNKLNSYPVNERKDLVLKATGSQFVKRNSNRVSQSAEMVLREDRIPSKQVTGRLELALGSIVKEIRSTDCQSDSIQKLLSNPLHQRTLKQAVRERLRNVMLNKAVGPVVDIVKKYRERFSKQSDKDIVELAIKTHHPKLVNVIETENPEEFFKTNITAIFEKKVEEMSVNLLKMYSNVRRKTTSAYTRAPDDTVKLDEAVERESIINTENAMRIIRGMTGKYVTAEERNVLTKYYTTLIEEILEEKLPKYLPKCSEQFLKIFDMDHKFKAVRFMAVKRVQSEIMKAETTGQKNENQTNNAKLDTEETLQQENSYMNDDDENILDEKEVIEEIVMEENTLVEKNETEEKATTKENEIETVTVDKDNITEDKTSTKIVSDKSITAESDNTEEVTSVKPDPKDVKESSSIIKSSTPTSIDTTASCATIKPTISAAKATKPSSTTHKTTVECPLEKETYYVKLIGRPKLPNRAVICEFLNKYQPKSIKKHKSINNLLVIGFINQEDYNKILAANETVIGDVTMIIKPSEKVNPGKEKDSSKEELQPKNEAEKEISNDNNVQEQAKDEDKPEEEVKSGNEICNETAVSTNVENQNEINDLIGKELDDQITDLLSTINKGDEEDKKSKQTPSLEPIKEDDVEDKETNETNDLKEPEKISKVKESGRATPVRSSSRLGNVTPSTIRTRRSSRLLQE